MNDEPVGVEIHIKDDDQKSVVKLLDDWRKIIDDRSEEISYKEIQLKNTIEEIHPSFLPIDDNMPLTAKFVYVDKDQRDEDEIHD